MKKNDLKFINHLKIFFIYFIHIINKIFNIKFNFKINLYFSIIFTN